MDILSSFQRRYFAKFIRIPTRISKDPVQTLKVPSSLSMSQSTDDNFQDELSWCIEQLEIGLETQNPSSKQAQEAVRVLKILTSSKAPLIKKRQAMRNTFGDYRKKMKESEKKSTAAIKKVKLSSGDAHSSNKSHFFKKSAAQSTALCLENQSNNSRETALLPSNCDMTGKLNTDFKFNFNINEEDKVNEFMESSQPSSSAANASEDLSVPTNFMNFEKSDNSFRFKFSVDS